MNTIPQDRYVTLDGMRGMSALIVAALHFNESLITHGYLAVDFFFGLSGFVIANAYVDKLRAGSSLAEFFKARFVRLFPLFLADIILGLIYHLQYLLRGGVQNLGFGDLVSASVFGGLMLPDPLSRFLYPLNPVFWSILCEVAMNIVFALWMIRLPKPAVWCVIILSGIVLYLTSNRIMTVNGGSTWDTIDIGFLRTSFSFAVGFILSRYSSKSVRPQTNLSVLIVLGLLALTIAPIIDENRLNLDLMAIYCILPLLLIIGSRMEPPARLRVVFCFVGDISYALYASHWPIALITVSMVHRFEVAYYIALPIFIIVTVIVATLLTKLWDQPMRKFISRYLTFRSSVISQAA